MQHNYQSMALELINWSTTGEHGRKQHDFIINKVSVTLSVHRKNFWTFKSAFHSKKKAMRLSETLTFRKYPPDDDTTLASNAIHDKYPTPISFVDQPASSHIQDVLVLSREYHIETATIASARALLNVTRHQVDAQHEWLFNSVDDELHLHLALSADQNIEKN